jgi:hypothetical protein
LKDEREALSTIKTERFQELYKQLRALEAGKPVPRGFCPAEDRKKLLQAWIEKAPKADEPDLFCNCRVMLGMGRRLCLAFTQAMSNAADMT